MLGIFLSSQYVYYNFIVDFILKFVFREFVTLIVNVRVRTRYLMKCNNIVSFYFQSKSNRIQCSEPCAAYLGHFASVFTLAHNLSIQVHVSFDAGTRKLLNSHTKTITSRPAVARSQTRTSRCVPVNVTVVIVRLTRKI